MRIIAVLSVLLFFSNNVLAQDAPRESSCVNEEMYSGDRVFIFEGCAYTSLEREPFTSTAIDCQEDETRPRYFSCERTSNPDIVTRQAVVGNSPLSSGTGAWNSGIRSSGCSDSGISRGKGKDPQRGFSDYVCRARQVLRLPGELWRITLHVMNRWRGNDCILYINLNYGGYRLCNEGSLVDLPNIRWLHFEAND